MSKMPRKPRYLNRLSGWVDNVLAHPLVHYPLMFLACIVSLATFIGIFYVIVHETMPGLKPEFIQFTAWVQRRWEKVIFVFLVLAVSIIYFWKIGPKGRRTTLLLYEGLPTRLFTDRIKGGLPWQAYSVVPILLTILFYAAIFMAFFSPEDESFKSIVFAAFWLLVGVVFFFILADLFGRTGLASYLVSLGERREPDFSERKSEAQRIVTGAFNALRLEKFTDESMEGEIEERGADYLAREEEIVNRYNERSSPIFGEHEQIRMAYFALRHLKDPQELVEATPSGLADLLKIYHDHDWNILREARKRKPSLALERQPSVEKESRYYHRKFAEYLRDRMGLWHDEVTAERDIRMMRDRLIQEVLDDPDLSEEEKKIKAEQIRQTAEAEIVQVKRRGRFV